MVGLEDLALQHGCVYTRMLPFLCPSGRRLVRTPYMPLPLPPPAMRFSRFDDQGTPRPCVLYDEYVLDLRAVTDGPEVLRASTDPELRARLDKLVRGRPPQSHLRRLDNARLLPPVEPGRVVLTGGAQGELEPRFVVNPGGGLPAGDWYTGVAAVVARDVAEGQRVPEDWMPLVAGWTTFHAVGDHLALGPWLADWDEVADVRLLAFSAFVDDLSRIRPAKALMDWHGALRAAHGARPLRAGDIVCLSAPAAETTGHVRSALVYDGTVLSRLEAVLA